MNEKLSAKDSHTMYKVRKEHENYTCERVHLNLSIQQVNKKQNIPNSGLEFVDKFYAFVFLNFDKKEPNTNFIWDDTNTEDHVVEDEICYCVIDVNETGGKVVGWLSIHFVESVQKQS